MDRYSAGFVVVSMEHTRRSHIEGLPHVLEETKSGQLQRGSHADSYTRGKHACTPGVCAGAARSVN